MGCSACHGIVDAQHQCPPLRTALRRRIARRPTAQFGQRHETIERCELRAAARKTSDLKAQGDASLVQRTTTQIRSEEHTSELQSLMRISYAVFCLKKKKK